MLLSSRGIIQGNLYSKTLSGQDALELNKSMESQKKNFKGNELKGKTLGIIGLGAIGSSKHHARNGLSSFRINYFLQHQNERAKGFCCRANPPSIRKVFNTSKFCARVC